jgi:hypothetical protein
MILGILVAVVVGTVLSLVATSLPLLLVGRILQGASYGLFPLSISVLRRELPHARHPLRTTRRDGGMERDRPGHWREAGEVSLPTGDRPTTPPLPPEDHA